MAFATENFTATASQTDFNFAMPYISNTHLAVTVAGVPATITFPSAQTFRLSVGASAGDAVQLKRTTPRDNTSIDSILSFQAGSTPQSTKQELQKDLTIYILQEMLDAIGDVSSLPTAVGQNGKYLQSDGTATPIWSTNVASSTDLVTRSVRNETGSTIVKGRAVYISGFDAAEALPLVALCDPDDAAKMPAIGIVQADIVNNTNGTVVISGNISTFNTSGFSVNDIAYVGPSGALLAEASIGTVAIVQPIAKITVDATNGDFQVLNNVETLRALPRGRYHISSSAATAVAGASTPLKIAGTTTASGLESLFTHTDNRLTYTGKETIDALVTVDLVAQAAASAKDWNFYIAKTGSIITTTRIGHHIVTLNQDNSVSLSTLVQLVENDYIEVWVENTTDDTDITVGQMNVSIAGLVR